MIKAFYLFFVVALATFSQNNAQICSDVFGSIPSLFNGFFFGNFDGNDSKVGGRLAVEGNCTLTGPYQVGTQLGLPTGSCTSTANITEDALVVGQSLNWQNGSAIGNIVYGQNLLALGPNVSSSVSNVGCSVIQNSARIDFNLWKTHLLNLSTSLAAVTPTATNVQLVSGTTLQFDVLGNTAIEVVSLDADVLLNATTVHITNIGSLAPNATIIFLVRSSFCGMINLQLHELQPFASKILWNFFGCFDLRLFNVNVSGSILAPDAFVNGTNGKIEGQIFAANFVGNFEFENVLFEGCIPQAQTTAPPCCSATCFEVFGNIPSLYNAFVFGLFLGENAEVEGRLAAKTDCIFPGRYNVATEVSGLETTISCSNAPPGIWLNNLVCGGSIDWQNGDIDIGNIVYGNQLNLGQSIENDESRHGCSTIQNATLIDFPRWEQHLIQLSKSTLQLSSTTSSGSVSGDTINFTLSGNSNALFEVITLDASVLLNARFIDIEDLITAGSSTTLVINAKGSPCGFQTTNFGGLNEVLAPKILWNFPECLQLNIANAFIPGTILAPQADCTGNNGQVDGQLFCKSYQGNLELGEVPFTGCALFCTPNTTSSCVS